MNRKANEEQVLGISFLRAETQPIGEFVDFLRQRGHFVSQTKITVSVSALPGSLEDMAQNVFELAREFDHLHGTLVANTLGGVWEYRNCCLDNGCHDEDPIWADVFATPEFASTGEWKESEPFDGHRRLAQSFARSVAQS